MAARRPRRRNFSGSGTAFWFRFRVAKSIEAGLESVVKAPPPEGACSGTRWRFTAKPFWFVVPTSTRFHRLSLCVVPTEDIVGVITIAL